MCIHNSCAICAICANSPHHKTPRPRVWQPREEKQLPCKNLPFGFVQLYLFYNIHSHYFKSKHAIISRRIPRDQISTSKIAHVLEESRFYTPAADSARGAVGRQISRLLVSNLVICWPLDRASMAG